MIYKIDEIQEVISELNADTKNKTATLAADMMDDMLHTLMVFEGFTTYLWVHGMIPSGEKECAKFWNRPQDQDNTRVWDDSDDQASDNKTGL